MSHYAEYIWPCYMLAFSLLGMQVVLALIAWKKALRFYKDKYAR